MRKLLVILSVLVLIIISCKKEEDPRDPVPKLEVINIGPSLVQEFTDSVVINIRYEDGDGDLGGGDPDKANLFVIDNRTKAAFEFRIQELVPGGGGVPINGQLSVVLQNLYITNGQSQQQVSFNVYAVDLAGNNSNTVTTEDILVYQ